MNEITKAGTFSLAPQNLKEAMEYAKILADSEMVPKDYRGKPGNVLVAVQMGAEIGLPPTQAIQNIAVINGRPSVWGDAMLAVCRGSSLCEYVSESLDESTMTATCIAKRKGDKYEVVRTFSQADAKTASLWGKQGPWTTSPKRMLQMRARAFCLRDAFPDLLRGISSAEEQQDNVERDVTPPPEVKKPERLTYSDEEFAKKLPQWTDLVESGKKSSEDILTALQSKADLTEGQKAIILDIGTVEGEYESAEDAA